jgi:uncharacterized protein YfaP (DUF2135 family)
MGVERLANQFYERLKADKKIRLILDDVWDKNDLDNLGVLVPQLGDHAYHKGSKIIVPLTEFLKDIYKDLKHSRS